MGLAAMMANIMSQDKIFAGDKQRSGMAFNPDYKPARDRKELRKFRIKGEEVEAACMGRQSGKTRRSPCSLAWLSNKITYKYVRKYEY